MKRNARRLLAVLLGSAGLLGASATAAVAAGPAPAITLFAAPNGHGDCSPGRPCSLTTVLDRERAAAATGRADVTVELSGGSYRTTGITLDARDSGRDGHTVRWRAAPGQSPVLDGGTPLTGWTPAGAGVWSAPAHGLNFLQLYTTTQRLTRARTPGLVEGELYTLAGSRQLQVRVPDSTLTDWNLSDLADTQVVVQNTWRQLRYDVDSVSADQDGYRYLVTGGPIGATSPGGDGGTNPVATATAVLSGSANRLYSTFLDNNRAFLDTDGEWYLDKAQDRVYLKSATDPDRQGVVAPTTQTLLTIDGASHLEIDGVQFAHSTWTGPAAGNLQRQGGVHFAATPQGKTADGWNIWYVNPGAVSVAHATDVRFDHDAFRDLGGNGIDVGAGTNGLTVTGSVFRYLADSGLFIGTAQDPHAPAAEQNVDTTVTDNYLADTGLDYATDSGITATYPNGLLVAHNTLERIKNIPINVGYINNIDPDTATDLQNVQVLDNRINGACLVAADCGGIHTKTDFAYGTTPNGTDVPRSSEQGNYLTGIHLAPTEVGAPGTHAVYLDNFTNNLLVQHDEWSDVDDGVHTNGVGTGNTVQDNDTGDPTVIAQAGLLPGSRYLATCDVRRNCTF